jgi:hypothetical protein
MNLSQFLLGLCILLRVYQSISVETSVHLLRTEVSTLIDYRNSFESSPYSKKTKLNSVA